MDDLHATGVRRMGIMLVVLVEVVAHARLISCFFFLWQIRNAVGNLRGLKDMYLCQLYVMELAIKLKSQHCVHSSITQVLNAILFLSFLLPEVEHMACHFS